MLCNGAVYSTKGEDSRIYKALGPDRFICGIADGHGGPAAARLCREHLSRLEDFCDPGLLFCELHQKCLPLECNSGASLTVCFVDGCDVHCANVGDSHALVVTPTSHYWISESHRLQDNVRERERLRTHVRHALGEEGGRVGPPRLYPGGLSCSRSIGDADCPLVECEPAISRSKLDKDDILLVASDGLWDSVPPSKVCRMVRESRCAETLLRAHSHGFGDDTSVIIATTQPVRRATSGFFRVSSNGSISSDDDEPPCRKVFKVNL